jgi:hypothetical protein
MQPSGAPVEHCAGIELAIARTAGYGVMNPARRPDDVARIGVMRAIHRHHVEEFDTSRKTSHWGKRKLNATNAGVV